ncbi:ATP-binding protein [Streptomyces sp. SBT349]|uniref:ATP-binding protein n=1 Tax=Streptomyces sp. SBT349 TaxID=1580539 RepID=UPI00066DFFF5|nr:LuxR family transcriptional regulator [Streptomyces sp. SBT349]
MLTHTDPAIRLDGSSLIGRDEELRFLEETLRSLRAGVGGFVLIEGPFGSGKSALLRALRGGAASAGFTVLRARGSELETGHSYGLARQFMDRWLASPDPGPPNPALSASAHLLAPFFERHEGARQEAPDSRRDEQVHHGLLRLLADVADQRPLVLLLDDLHLADSASLRLLGDLGRRLAGHPILCCATAPLPARPGAGRDVGGARVRALLAPVVPHSLTLGPLSESGVGAYLSTAVPGWLPPASVRAVHEATAGSPFFLSELVGELTTTRYRGAADPARITGIGPRTVARGVLRWIHHLPRQRVSSALACAHALAVLGVADGVEQLAGVAGLDPSDAAAAVDALRDVGVIDQVTPTRFTASIVRNAIYHHMSHALRYRAHYTAAQTLADEGAPPQRIAEHLLHVPPSTDGRAVEILVAAGRTALRDGDPALALSLVRRAAKEKVPPRTLPLLLAVLGEAEHRTGQPHAARHLRDALDLTTDPADRAALALLLGEALAAASRYEEAAEVYRTSHAEVHGHHPALAGRLCSASSSLDHDVPDGYGLAPEFALEIGTAVRPGGAERAAGGARDLALHATRALLGGESGDRVAELVDQALTQDIAIRDADADTRVPWFLAYCLCTSGRLSESGTILDNAIQQAVTVGAESRDLRALRSFVNLNRGMLSEAKSDATATLEDGAAGEGPAIGRPFAVLALTCLLLLRNQHDAAEAVFEQHGGWDESRPRRLEILPLLIGRRHLHTARGNHRSAERDGEEIFDLLRKAGSASPALSPAPGMVENLMCLGKKEKARRLAVDHLAVARAFGSTRVVARAMYAYARTSQGGEAIEALEEAVRLLGDSAAVVDRCACLLQLGGVLRHGGQTAAARRRLREADEMAESIGASSLTLVARRALGALGVRVRDSARPHGSGLTPREYRVSVLAAEGKRNHEIARILFVTVKTVEWHLSQVYRKLRIDSRNELSRVLSLG